MANTDLYLSKTEPANIYRLCPTLASLLASLCSKDFIDTHAFQCHIKSKPHKRRLHALKTDPYTIEESERAAGMGSYVMPKKRKMETVLPDAVKDGITDAIDVVKRAMVDKDGDEKMK